MRLSQANEDRQRAPNHQPTSSERTQATLRLRQRFPKQVRLRNRLEFRKVQKEGRRIQGFFLVFQFTKENFSYPRLGVTVSKQFGSAVLRNLLKRRLREVFRVEKHRLPPGICLHIAPKPKTAMPTLQQIQADFTLLLDQLRSID